jgi:hypothetical protein
MKHDPSSDVMIRLQDGKSLLAEWTHRFDTLPTIGERIHIEDISGEPQHGYKDSAMVFRVDQDLRNHRVTLVLDAVPDSEKRGRNVVHLNANYVPEAKRQTIEEFVRKHIDMPVFEWVYSQEPAPIVELHGPTTVSRAAIGQLQAKIRNVVGESSPPAMI